MKTKNLFIIVLIFFATKVNAQWQQINPPPGIIACLAIHDSTLFAGNGYGSAGLYISNDKGSTWTLANNWDPYTSVLSLAVDGNNIYAGVYDYFNGGGNGGGVLMSDNNGASWSLIGWFSSGFEGVDVLNAQGTNICAGVGFFGQMLSVNSGATWQPMPALPLGDPAISLALLGNRIFAGGIHGTSLSDTSASAWSCCLLPVGATAFAVDGANIFAGQYDFQFGFGQSVQLSVDSGITWNYAGGNGLTYSNVSSLAMNGAEVFAGTGEGGPGGGVFLSYDNGNSWNAINTGLTNLNILALSVSTTDIYAITSGNSLFRRPLSDFTTGINQLSNDNPGFIIYPNPAEDYFNIQLNSEIKNARFEMSNILGKKIFSDKIINNNQTMNCRALAPGIYFVKVYTGEKEFTKKVIIQ